MGQKIGDLIWNAMILAGFIYLFLIMIGKVKPAQPIKLIQQPSILVKILICLGLLCFTVLVVLDLLGK
jgi:hypothetical protein